MEDIDRIDFRNNPPERVHALLVEHGFSAQRIQNFKNALRTRRISSLGELKGVKNLEPLLPFLPFRTLVQVVNRTDGEGNHKFVFSTDDDHLIESVLMESKREVSLCISVQAGCRFRCRFCRTGSMGLKRNLLPFELLEQVRQIYLDSIHPGRLSCITFMGMGEPFDNLKCCRIAFDWMRTDWGWSVGAKKITFSTIGELNWDDFFRFESLPNLAVSLHSANQEKRRFLMPGASIQLETLREHMIRYTERTNKQISIEYCLFEGVNDSRSDARKLAGYLRGLPCKVNLLNYNPVDVKNFRPVSEVRIEEFKFWLKQEGSRLEGSMRAESRLEGCSRESFPVIYRKSRGVGIGAGCGQLGTGV